LHTARGEFIAFIDDDAVADRLWLYALRQAWLENRDAGAFTGAIAPLELSSRAQIFFERRGGFARGYRRRRYGAEEPGIWFYPCGAGMFGAGCNMVIRRSVLLDIGGFDEALGTAKLAGGDDHDIFYRIVCARHPLVYEPALLVFHQHRHTLSGLHRQMWSWGLGTMAFVQKSCRSNPVHRRRFGRMVAWWFARKMLDLLRSTWNSHGFGPPSLDLAEIAGGITGLCGAYGRSRRRIQERSRLYS
jgi:GT2 family glycosyltransferase